MPAKAAEFISQSMTGSKGWSVATSHRPMPAWWLEEHSSLSPCRQVSVRDVIPPTNACHGGLRNIPLSVLGRQVSVRDVVPPTNACHGGLRNIPLFRSHVLGRQVSVRDVIPPTNACHGGLRNIPLSVLGRQISVRDVIPPTNACCCLNSSLSPCGRFQ